MSNAELITRLRKASTAVYLATDEAVANDLSEMLQKAADALSEKACHEHPHP